MPCHVDPPTAAEIESGLINRLLCELEGKARKRGYQEYDFSATPDKLKRKRKMLSEACAKHSDLSKFSLELQMWYRDYKKSILEEKQEQDRLAKRSRLIKSAKSKLSKEEFDALFPMGWLP